MKSPGRAPVSKLAYRLCYGLAVTVLFVLIGLGVWMAAVGFRADYHLSEAQKASEKDRFDEARKHLDLVLELRPTSAEAEYLAARAARRDGDAEEAKRHLNRSKELGWVEEAIRLEQVLAEAQRDPRPFEGYLFDCVNREHPDREVILEALSRGFIAVLDLPKALHFLDVWLERKPDSIRALSYRGDVRERQNRVEEARQDFQRIVDLDPARVEARTRLATLLLKERKLGEAATHFELAYQQRPEDAAVLRGLAKCRQEQDRPAEAEQLLDRALVLHPHDVLMLTQSGVLALEMGHPEKAEALLRRAVEKAPFEREPLFNFNRCLQALGKEKEARQWEERLVQVEADLKLVKKEMEQVLTNPQNPNPRKELGVIFLRNAQDKEGLRWLQSALQCEPRHRLTHQVLADYFEKQGRADLASRHRQLAE